MKESRYNYFVKDGNQIICLNGISGNVFTISIDAYHVLKELLLRPNDVSNDSELIQLLYTMKFLIDDEFQEIDYLKQLYKKAIRSDCYDLTINPTQECNFRCWYCYEKHNEGYMTPATMKNVEKFIDKVMNRNDINAFQLNWFGGEPLLYFDEVLYPLAMYTKEKAKEYNKKYYGSMTTNGYHLDTRIIAKCKDIELKLLQITLDGNRELHNKTRNNNGAPSFDKILNNVIEYCSFDSENKVILRINYTNEVIETGLKDVFASIPVSVRSQISINFQRVWQTIGTSKSPEALLDNIKYTEKLGFPLTHNSSFAVFRGKLCYADSLNYANINYDGNVYRCTANEYSLQNRLGYLNDKGDIVWVKKDIMDKVDEKTTFDNEMCLKCKNLAICGGLCFNHRLEHLISPHKYSCVKAKLDTGVDTFVKEYYNFYLKKRSETK